MLQGPRVEVGGLVPGPEGDALVGRAPSEVDDGVVVAGTDGVVGALHEVDTVAEHCECPSVELPATVWCHQLIDGLAREIVAEVLLTVVVHQQPNRETLVDGRGVALADGLDELDADAPAEHGGGVEGIARRVAEGRDPCGDEVEHRRRHRSGRSGKGLDHEERVAARVGVDVRRIIVAIADHRPHRVDRQRRHPQPRHQRPDERAGGEAQRVVGGEAVAVRGEDEAGEPVETAGRVAQQIERGFVGPLQVVENHHRGLGADLGEEGVEHGALVLGGEGVGEWPGPIACHVYERAERPGGKEVVASADQHPRVPEVVVDQLLHQSRLPGPGLPTEDEQVPRAVESREPVEHRPHLLVPLEETHVRACYGGRCEWVACPVLTGLLSARASDPRLGLTLHLNGKAEE